MKLISLTQNKYAIVDDLTFDRVNQYKWYANNQHGYWVAVRNISINGKQTHERMHRFILNLGKTDKRLVDHHNHNTLDNRFDNLRLCTKKQNNQNKTKRKSITKSKYKGVIWKELNKKWQARITVDRKRLSLGLFIKEDEAAEAYNIAAKKYFGEFAYLNII